MMAHDTRIAVALHVATGQRFGESGRWPFEAGLGSFRGLPSPLSSGSQVHVAIETAPATQRADTLMIDIHRLRTRWALVVLLLDVGLVSGSSVQVVVVSRKRSLGSRRR
jgi:hypothetical protein